MTSKHLPTEIKDTPLKRYIMNVCSGTEHKHYVLRRVALEYGAIADPIDCVWIFPDGTRCGCVVNYKTQHMAIYFVPDIPEKRDMH